MTALNFALPAAITIETVEALAADLKQLSFTEKAVITLDASQTENITTPGIQLIVSVEKIMETLGGGVKISNARPAVIKTFQTIGLERLLAQPIVETL